MSVSHSRVVQFSSRPLLLVMELERALSIELSNELSIELSIELAMEFSKVLSTDPPLVALPGLSSSTSPVPIGSLTRPCAKIVSQGAF